MADPTRPAARGRTPSRKPKSAKTSASASQSHPAVDRTALFGIRLENFRAYRDPAWFPIRPVTLLFGANSSGKSTFLSAISALRQSFLFTAPALVVRGREVDLGPTHSVPHADRPRDDTE